VQKIHEGIRAVPKVTDTIRAWERGGVRQHTPGSFCKHANPLSMDFLRNVEIFGEGLAEAARLAERTSDFSGDFSEKRKCVKRSDAQARNENFSFARSLLDCGSSPQ
jgi:hypothetical protein